MPTDQHHHTYQRATDSYTEGGWTKTTVPAGPLMCMCGKVYDPDRIVDVAEIEGTDDDTPSTGTEDQIASWRRLGYEVVRTAELDAARAELESVSAKRDYLYDRLESVRADRDRLAAAIARVEAEVNAWADCMDDNGPYVIAIRGAIADVAEMCINGHPFAAGVDIDMEAEGRTPDPRWCNVCGDSRKVVRAALFAPEEGSNDEAR